MAFVVVAHASRAYVGKLGDGLEEVKRYFGFFAGERCPCQILTKLQDYSTRLIHDTVQI